MKNNLTAEDILKKKFSSEINGYHSVQVDAFLDKVLTDYNFFESEIDSFKKTIKKLSAENKTLKATLDNDKITINRLKTQNKVLAKKR